MELGGLGPHTTGTSGRHHWGLTEVNDTDSIFRHGV